MHISLIITYKNRSMHLKSCRNLSRQMIDNWRHLIPLIDSWFYVFWMYRVIMLKFYKMFCIVIHIKLHISGISFCWPASKTHFCSRISVSQGKTMNQHEHFMDRQSPILSPRLCKYIKLQHMRKTKQYLLILQR